MSARHSSRFALDTSIILFAGVAALCSSEPELRRLFIAATWLWSGLILVRWHRFGFSAREVVAFALVFRIIFFVTPPTLSDDFYRYLWDGMLQHHGINPFHYRPVDGFLSHFHTHPLFERLNSEAFYSVYPPVPQAVFWLSAVGLGDDYSTNLFILRALLAGAEFGAVILLVRTVDPRAAALYALHPLAAIELAGEIHAEALLVLFLVGVFWAWKRHRLRLMVTAVILAGLTKLYPFVLLPFVIRRAGWKRALPGLALGVVVAAPYVDITAIRNMFISLDLYVRFFEFNAGFYYGLKELLSLLTGDDQSKTLGPLMRWAFLAAVAFTWWKDRHASLSLPRAAFYVFAAFFLLSTTIHPWYLTGMLVVVPFLDRPAWAWLFLAAASLGSYERYVDGYYWEMVAVAWIGFAVVAVATNRNRLLDRLQRRRARRKARKILPWLPRNRHIRILDIGAGEGFVGAEMARRLRAEVELLDVIDLNRTDLPLTVYTGREVPFRNNTFDHALLIFVLHHCEDAEQVLAEAARVARGRIIVLESVYENEPQRKLLSFLDRWANRVRSGGMMRAQEDHVQFRTAGAWRGAFKRLGLEILVERRWGSSVHLQHLFVLEKAGVRAGD